MKKSNYSLNRRKFLADCGKMTGIGAMSSMLSLQMTNKLFAQRAPGSVKDYKALVCVFLYGGNDSFNLLLPGASEYDQYLQTRRVLGFAKTKLDQRKIVDSTLSQDFHVNPSASGIRSMFNAGDLSFVANVGSLVEPTTMQQFRQRSVKVPYGLYSHNDQIEQWQVSYSTSKTSKHSGTGWAGRVLDVINDAANNNSTVSVNLAPYGANITQIGRTISPFLTNGGVDALDLYSNSSSLAHQGIDASLEEQYANILQAHHNYVRKEAIDQSVALEKIEKSTSISTSFPNSSLGQQLKQVAKYIKANKNAGSSRANRQTFFVGQTGFDTHGGGTGAVASQTKTLNDALVAFNNFLKNEIKLHNNVTTYTASDFGRSLTPNSSGSDHGWGGNQIVMGGAVKGKRVFGKYPDIALKTSTDTGRGRQLPTTSVDELHASLAYWYGVQNNSEMEAVVPNIRNYWSRSNRQYPIAGLF